MTKWVKTIWSTRDVGHVLVAAIGIDIEDIISLLEDDEQYKEGFYNHWLVTTADATYEVKLSKGGEEAEVTKVWSAMQPALNNAGIDVERHSFPLINHPVNVSNLPDGAIIRSDLGE